VGRASTQRQFPGEYDWGGWEVKSSWVMSRADPPLPFGGAVGSREKSGCSEEEIGQARIPKGAQALEEQANEGMPAR
jgi:hypothetical protein